jgi:hypothetical protein
MKKLWNYRFYILAISGLLLMICNIYNAQSNIKLILWGLGMLISFTAVLLQIIIAPNFNAKCPDCNADLNCQNGKITFKKHSV